MLVLLLLLWLCGAWAQIYVVPQRPGQTVLRPETHRWQTAELLVGEELQGSPAGGVRLFFDARERATAERAAAEIEAAYRELAVAFAFTPPRRFDYVLYGSYAAFLRTNLFPVQEGVLGVTSPAGLEITLPYMGDPARFARVSRHELAHQFTIQRVRQAARRDGAWASPLDRLPLWFIEGLAEHHAHGRRLDEETRGELLDLLANPDPYRGFALPHFMEDARGSTLLTYELGHARVSFLAETWGEEALRELLDRSPELLGKGARAEDRARTFSELLEAVTGEELVVIGARFDAWLKRRLLPEWLDSALDPGGTRPYTEAGGQILALDAGTDGELLVLRRVERGTGRIHLLLVDPRRPGSARVVARDDRPGSESLHPLDPRSFDLGRQVLVHLAEARGHDVLHQHRVEVVQRQRRAEEAGRRPRQRLVLRDHRVHRLLDGGLGAALTVALSPDEERAALIGLDRQGQRDLWILDLGTGALRRRTQDPAAERELAWGPAGLVYSSDATADGDYELFGFDPDGDSPPRRLTTRPGEEADPAVLPGGRLVLTAPWGPHRDVFELTEAGLVRRTDSTTALADPAPGPDGGLWALLRDAGQQWPVRLPPAALADGPPEALDPWGGPPRSLPTRSLEGATPYRPLRADSWGLDSVFGLVGAGGGGLWGQVYLAATDVLRDHALVLQGAAYGSPELVDASLVHLDQGQRLVWGAGAFSALRFRIEERYADEGVVFQAGYHYHGLLVVGRWPLDRFVHVQAEQAVGLADPFLLDATEAALADPTQNAAGRDLLTGWLAEEGGPRAQAETTLRLGVDTTSWHPATGPVSGGSVLIEQAVAVQPGQGELSTSLRVDGEGYLPIDRDSGANLGLRGAAGTALGGAWTRSWYLYGPYTLRGVAWGDPDFLLGRHFWWTTAELQVPLDSVVRVAFLDTIEGVAGLDLGAAADEGAGLWSRRVLDVALGANLVLGPLVFRLHFARPIDTGAPLPDNPQPWVTNLSLGWLGG